MAATQRGVKVLIVDDTSDFLRILTVAMKGNAISSDWEVVTAGSADEALIHYREALRTGKPFDLIISDIAMPNRSGLDMAKEIRETDKDVKLMMHTAHTGALNRQAAEDLGAGDLLIKPIVPRELIKRAADVLGK